MTSTITASAKRLAADLAAAKDALPPHALHERLFLVGIEWVVAGILDSLRNYKPPASKEPLTGPSRSPAADAALH